MRMKMKFLFLTKLGRVRAYAFFVRDSEKNNLVKKKEKKEKGKEKKMLANSCWEMGWHTGRLLPLILPISRLRNA